MINQNKWIGSLPSTIKKFSKCKNIIIVGMGGSILGAKSIYSFFKKKVKKDVFFLIIWMKIYI